MPVKIEYITVGFFYENTYFLIDENTHRAIIVDPGGSGLEIEEFLSERNLSPHLIINTHGHIDHVEANEYLKKKYSLQVFIHPVESEVFGVDFDKPLNDGDVIEFAGGKLKVLHTPGHTMGSICLLGEGFMLTGDTIFAGSIGRTDLGGDMEVMTETLASRFEGIPDETVLWPGHGEVTTLGEEKRTNIFMKSNKST